MPAVIAVAAAYVSSSAFITAVVTTAISVGAKLAYSALTGSKSKARPNSNKSQSVQNSKREETAPRRRFYGRCQASGPWNFGGSHNGDFHKCLNICHGRIRRIINFKIDDHVVDINDLDENGVVTTGHFANKVKLEYRLGDSPSSAYSELVEKFDYYTNEFRCDGIFTIYAKQYAVAASSFNETFPKSYETVYRVEFEGVLIKNLATGNIEYSNNAADVIFDYLTFPDGHNIPESVFNTPQAQAKWLEARAICAELVPLKAGGTEPRYTINGSYDFVERPADVLPRFLGVCDGKLLPTQDGGIYLEVGKHYEPTVILDGDVITGYSSLSKGNDVFDNANVIKALFTNPEDNYTEGDADPWRDEDDITARGEVVFDTEFLATTSHAQCKRLMKLEGYRKNPKWQGQFSTNVMGLAAVGESLNVIRLPNLGIDDDFEVGNLNFELDENYFLTGLTLDVATLPAEAREWNPALEEGTAPIATEIDEESNIPAPTGIDVTIDRIQSGSTIAAYAVVDFDAPPSDSLNTKVRYRKTNSYGPVYAWNTVFADEGSLEVSTPVLSDGIEYEFQVAHYSLAEGEWSDSILITPTADETAPDPVLSVTKTGGVAEVTLGWATPNSANYSRSVIYRSTTSNVVDAIEIATIYGAANANETFVNNNLAVGDYYYWIAAANASGVESTKVATGIVSVT